MRFILFCLSFFFFFVCLCVRVQEGPRIKAQNIEKRTNNTYCVIINISISFEITPIIYSEKRN